MIDFEAIGPGASAGIVFQVAVIVVTICIIAAASASLLARKFSPSPDDPERDRVVIDGRWFYGTAMLVCAITVVVAGAHLKAAVDRGHESAHEVKEIFTEALREQYNIEHVTPSPQIGLGHTWTTFAARAANADGPSGAPSAQIYTTDGVSYTYYVSLDNETGEIELYADGDAGASFVHPSELRK